MFNSLSDTVCRARQSKFRQPGVGAQHEWMERNAASETYGWSTAGKPHSRKSSELSRGSPFVDPLLPLLRKLAVHQLSCSIHEYVEDISGRPK